MLIFFIEHRLTLKVVYIQKFYCLPRIYLLQLCVKEAIRLILLNKIFELSYSSFELCGFRMCFERF